MRVIIIALTPFPNGLSSTNRIICYAKALVSQGVDCEVWIYQRTERNSTRNSQVSGIWEGINFRYIGSSTLRSKNPFIRKAYDFIDKYMLLKRIKKELTPSDIVLGYIGNNYNFATKYLIPAVHAQGAKYVRELCELPYETDNGNNEKLRDSVLKNEFPICDGFIAISQQLQQLAQAHKNENAKIIKVPILVEYEKYKLEDLSTQADFPYILHSGSLTNQKDGIEMVIEAFAIASKELDKEIHFISTGVLEKSKYCKSITNIIEKYGIQDRIHFLGYIDNATLQDKLSKASLVISNKFDNNRNRYCFATKIGEYLAASKPLILTDVGEAMNWFEDGVNCYVVEAGNLDALTQGIINAFKDPNKMQSIGKNGQVLCERCFDYSNYGEPLKNYFRSLLEL